MENKTTTTKRGKQKKLFKIYKTNNKREKGKREEGKGKREKGK